MSRNNMFDMFMDSQRDSFKVRSEMKAVKADPERRARTKVFGQEAIRGSVKCFVLDLIAILLAFLAYLLFGALKFEVTLIFKIILLIILIGGSGGLVIATLFLHIRYFRYVRYQKAANRHPIARRAKGWCVFSLLFNLAIIVVAVIFIFLALKSV